MLVTITDNMEYTLMTDSKCPFFQAFGMYPHLEDPKDCRQMLVFKNPSLLFLSKTPQLDMYIDATWKYF